MGGGDTVAVSAPWANRITRHAEVDPATLTANPANWRGHPKQQADALSGVLSEVGYVQSVIVNERSGRIVDGHLRVSLAVERGEPSVPVVYVDLDDAEERLVLATLDPLGALAETSAEQLGALLAEAETSDDALRAMLDGLARDAGIVPPDFEPVSIDDQGRLDRKAPVTCPECGCEFSPT
jgi:hypothetical protein